MSLKLAIEVLIEQDRRKVFDLLVDLRHYGAWLPHSTVFAGTAVIAAGPIAVGTTYVETSFWGARHGLVTALEPPARVSYSQPMTLRPGWAGVIDIHIDDVLEEAGAKTRLTRYLRLDFEGPVRFLDVAVGQAFEREIRRTQARLKAYAETLPREAA
ncbi:MAG: SRPBCC family protein [Caulobacter sp.]|nr:SRPBCC family protein [Caulobacter sp.]